MKLFDEIARIHDAAAAAPARHRRGWRGKVAGFTMVEIALCIAIIGIALVAIIGVLPAGLTVQKESREETIIAQDAAVWMDAIRNGARGLDDLTNYIVVITNYVDFYDLASPNSEPTRFVNVFTVNSSTENGADTSPSLHLVNGQRIVGLISRPKIAWLNDDTFASNHVVAVVRAMSGAAVEKFPQDNPEVLGSAFTYRMIPELTSYVPFGLDANTVNYEEPGLPEQEKTNRLNRLTMIRNLQTNAHDLRLTFRWPVLPAGRVGIGRQTFRTFVGGRFEPVPTNSNPNLTLYFLEPPNYVRVEIE